MFRLMCEIVVWNLSVDEYLSFFTNTIFSILSLSLNEKGNFH
jgi:hypothetical protein